MVGTSVHFHPILILRIQKHTHQLHDMTPIICTSHPADKLKTINAAPVIMVHRHCRELITGLVASDGASVLHDFTTIDMHVADIQVDLPKKGTYLLSKDSILVFTRSLMYLFL